MSEQMQLFDLEDVEVGMNEKGKEYLKLDRTFDDPREFLKTVMNLQQVTLDARMAAAKLLITGDRTLRYKSKNEQALERIMESAEGSSFLNAKMSPPGEA